MREIQYKDFSLETHQKNWHLKRPNMCQFELTFKCDFNCKYCYCSCYNRRDLIKRELDTSGVKIILDKLYEAGIVWVCFSGGDPLTRDDFFDIYSYAKRKGFIISIFANAYSLDERKIERFRDNPPFVIEITLNSVREETFEAIADVRGSFGKFMNGLKLLIGHQIPLKIKTIILKDNLEEIFEIKEFVESLNLAFRADVSLNAGLEGDTFPCSLRISCEKVIEVNKILQAAGRNIDSSLGVNKCYQDKEPNKKKKYIFRCSAGSNDSIFINPYGEMFFCPCLRQLNIDILRNSIEAGLKRILPQMRKKPFKTNSKCKTCQIREFCFSCPGYAYLETGDLEAPIEWYCQLAHLTAKEQNSNTKLLNC